MFNSLDSEMTDDLATLIKRNMEVSLVRAGVGVKATDSYYLSEKYQEKIIREVLSSKPSVLNKFEKFDSFRFKDFSDNSDIHSRLRNISCLDDYFYGEEDSFELRVAKSRLLPVKESLYCHGSTLYLSGVLSKPFLLVNNGEFSARTILEKLGKRGEGRDLREDLELKVQLYYSFNDFNHSNVVRNGLVFDRLYNGAEFRIIPKEEYSPHDGVGFTPHNRVESFRTSYKEFKDLELDRRMHDLLKV